MARAKTAVAPPRAALPAHEENRYLAKVKTSLVRRWSHTRMKELYEQADLARYLWALDREAEALDVLRSVTSVVPPPGGAGVPNYNVWSPVVTMNALEARICRLGGDDAGAAAPVSRLMADPGLAPNRDYIAAEVAEAPSGFADANAETSVKWACHKLSRKIGGLTLLCELGVAGHPYGDWYDVEEADRLIATGRALLAARLAMRPRRQDQESPEPAGLAADPPDRLLDE